MNLLKLHSLSFTLLGVIAVSCLIGCQEVTTEKDLADARQNVASERRATEEARIAGQENIVAAEQRLEDARHEALRVPYEGGKSDDVLQKETELAEAKQDLDEKVASEEQRTMEAEEKAQEVEAKLTATNERDAYLASAKIKLNQLDNKLEAMSDEHAGLDNELAQQKIQTEIDVLQVKRDALKYAIREVEGVGVLLWQTKKPLVESAMENLNSTGLKSNDLNSNDLDLNNTDDLGSDGQRSDDLEIDNE
jgi:hypothetical protein